jgi:hypothetical protein
MASLRRAVVAAASVAGLLSGLSGPASAFEVVKRGGPAARLLFLGLGDRERACGAFELAAGDARMLYEPLLFGCGAYHQFVVIVRAPFGPETTLAGEWCEAFLTADTRLTLLPETAGDRIGPPMRCALEPR